MPRPDRSKVPVVESDQVINSQSLGHRDDRCVDKSDRVVSILDHDLAGSLHVTVSNVNQREGALRQGRKRGSFTVRTEMSGDHVA
jgi:hypothetical protein